MDEEPCIQPEPGDFPVSTLVQRVGKRGFVKTQRNVDGMEVLVLSFPRGLTILMAANNENRPIANGLAEMSVHRKFITPAAMYLHWVSITFTIGGPKIQAQIMKQDRLSAALAMVRGGAYACFLRSPLRPLRRERNIRRRKLTSNR